MNKEFSPVVANAKLKTPKNQPQPISMQELEGGLLNYFANELGNDSYLARLRGLCSCSPTFKVREF